MNFKLHFHAESLQKCIITAINPSCTAVVLPRGAGYKLYQSHFNPTSSETDKMDFSLSILLQKQQDLLNGKANGP